MTPADTEIAPGQLTSVLTIDLDAIVANWKQLAAMSQPGCETAAVIKADAYGCGADRVGPALLHAGCQSFYVALPMEGAQLRDCLGMDAVIRVLGGYDPGQKTLYQTQKLQPVLNSFAQAKAWFHDFPGDRAAMQVETGMHRLGIEAEDFAALLPLPDCVTHLLSHLACADEPDHPMNAAQLQVFKSLLQGQQIVPSLAATGGILLGPDYHFGQTRPGIGLFGGAPFSGAKHVVRLETPIIQIRNIPSGGTVGYGATWRAARPSRIATVAAGYADGLLRAAGSGQAAGYFNGQRLPFAGRVSMDLITLDVTDCPQAQPGAMIEILGPHQSIDDLATAAGTIGYEILTSLGRRYRRQWLGG